MRDNRPQAVFNNFAVFACDKDQMKWWCIGRSIDYTDFLYALNGESKADLKQKLNSLDSYDVIILRDWYRKETVHFDICNRILMQARYVFTTTNMEPIVKETKIVDWTVPTRVVAGRDAYFLPGRASRKERPPRIDEERVQYIVGTEQ